MIRSIIIEDEIAARSLLSKILDKYCSDIQIIGYSDNTKDGLDMIVKENPDLVFFDIQLKDGDSFQILNKLENINFKIIFTTAYNHHAIKAFNFDAIHYILKPYQITDVVESVQRVKKIIRKEEPFKGLIQNHNKSYSKDHSKISVSTKEGLTIVNIEEVIRLEADRSYCFMHLLNKETLFISKPLKTYEDTLLKSNFFRTHSSHLINLKHVKKYIKEDGGEIIMMDGTSIPLARRRKASFLNKL